MWIVVTFLATIFQTLRTAAQARLRPDLSVNAASYVRYILGAPLSIAACMLAVWWSADGMPTIPVRFWFIVTAAGIAQIVGTIALLTAFDRRDFAIGTVYSKTEVIQVAVFSTVIVGEPLQLWGWVSVIAV
ncbi:MAG: EamA/RhaT family transporter, partial [Ilumatobacteraceae bacterium]